MDIKLLEYLFNEENFSGANAYVELPVSKDLINLVLKNIDVRKIKLISLRKISNGELEFFIQTSIPLHKNNLVRIKIYPVVKLPDLVLKAEVVSGLNKVQMFLINLLTDKKVEFEENCIKVQLKTFLYSDNIIMQRLHLLKELAIKTIENKLILEIKMEVN